MLASLYIKNYALIGETRISFDKGFTIITGETGAGKSILLGALGLVLGERADVTALRNADEKCIIEAIFKVSKSLLPFFDVNDLDFEEETLIRREVLSGGKSRAFINDTPVNLTVLQELGAKLIDIHSQHQTHEIMSEAFQFELLDSFSGQQSVLRQFQENLGVYRLLDKQILQLKEELSAELKEQDYHLFLLHELEEAKLKSNEQTETEQQLQELSQVDAISEKLQWCLQLSGQEEIGLLNQLKQFRGAISKLGDYSDRFKGYRDRFESLWFEFKDLMQELEQESDKIVHDPALLVQMQERLNLIYNLHQKHQTQTIDELLQIQNELQLKSGKKDDLEDQILQLESQKQTLRSNLEELSSVLHNSRINHAPELIIQIKNYLKNLGMPDADIKIDLELSPDFNAFGKSALSIPFSANKGGNYGTLKKVASGGELSRVMFSVKSILAKYQQLPSIIFDEIDTGVSGEIADKMAEMMKELSHHTQVISITHLAQIAAKGHQHYKVYKKTKQDTTFSEISQLTQDERIIEIAQMVSGAQVSESAILHAKALLN
jgi:DNA repair protein RecN (Recombination protein N)